jgi:hypothetical protein
VTIDIIEDNKVIILVLIDVNNDSKITGSWKKIVLGKTGKISLSFRNPYKSVINSK